jgi:hypothetical protein
MMNVTTTLDPSVIWDHIVVTGLHSLQYVLTHTWSLVGLIIFVLCLVAAGISEDGNGKKRFTDYDDATPFLTEEQRALGSKGRGFGSNTYHNNTKES